MLLAVQGFLALLCAGIPLGWVPGFFGPNHSLVTEGLLEGAVGLWMVLAGFGTGAAFPLVCQLRSQRDPSVGRVAGSVNAVDHLGAALGALVPGILLVPAFGLARTGTLLAILQIAAFALVGLNLLPVGKRGVRSSQP